jgi:3-methylfumaryl-CoA hydratase
MTDRQNGWPNDGFKDWIGRRHIGTDRITKGLIERFGVTVPLADLPGKAASIPPCLHWCLAPIAEPAEKLGPDGHPTLGLHLPPIPLSRRMWAGGELRFHDPLATSDDVQRVSVIRSIERKEGRTGPLVFVTVLHELSTPRGPALSETQDIVYRDPSGNIGKRFDAVDKNRPADAPRASIETGPVLLFRYSALTFNGHRIHYDHPYATGVEGYDGLVVHGPLMATLLANLAQGELGRLETFRFRSQSPLVCGERLELFSRRAGEGLEMEARAGDGRLVMTAEAQ